MYKQTIVLIFIIAFCKSRNAFPRRSRRRSIYFILISYSGCIIGIPIYMWCALRRHTFSGDIFPRESFPLFRAYSVLSHQNFQARHWIWSLRSRIVGRWLCGHRRHTNTDITYTTYTCTICCNATILDGWQSKQLVAVNEQTGVELMQRYFFPSHLFNHSPPTGIYNIKWVDRCEIFYSI